MGTCLSDFLAGLAPDTMVCIGARGYRVAGYFHIGEAGSFNGIAFDVKNRASLRAVRKRCLHEMLEYPSEEARQKYDEACRACDEYVPVQGRPVAETYQTTYDGLAILVPGVESGAAKSKPPDKPIRYVTEDFTQAVVRLAARDYAHGLLERHLTVNAMSARDFMLSSWFGLFTDLDGEKLVKQIEADPKAVLPGMREK